MKTYKFYWLDGTVSTHRGMSPGDALNKAGFGSGALRALDHWEQI
jgi:hypothetical protein